MTQEQKTEISDAAAQLYMYAGFMHELCLFYEDEIDINKENITEWLGKIEEHITFLRKQLND